MIAYLNVFRIEVLLGLWLIRTVGRFVPSWRDAFKGDKLFAWAKVGDRREAYETMLFLAGFGMSLLGALGVVLFMPLARYLGFPPALEFLAIWAPAVPVLSLLCAWILIRIRLSGPGVAIGDDSNWETDVENNRSILIGASAVALVLSLALAALFVLLVPNLD